MIVTCAFDSAMINLGLYKRCKSRGERAITMERKRTAYLNEIMSSEAREDVKVGLRNLWTRIEKAERQIGESLEDGYSREKFIKLLSLLKPGAETTFRTQKSVIQKYINRIFGKNDAVLESIKYSDLDASVIYEAGFFRDFPALRASVKEALNNSVQDESVYFPVVSGFYLAWIGLTKEEAITLKIEDMQGDCIKIAGRNIYPNAEIMKYLRDYAAADEILIIDSNKERRRALVPSVYLLRTITKDRISKEILKHKIWEFNRSCGSDFEYNKIYWSGIYNRAYIYEMQNGKLDEENIDLLSGIFQEDYAAARVPKNAVELRLGSYRKFRDYFYPKPE